jgi:hypothetical protein
MGAPRSQCDGALFNYQNRMTEVVCYGLDQAPFPAVALVLKCKQQACGATHGLTYWCATQSYQLLNEFGHRAGGCARSVCYFYQRCRWRCDV